MTRVFLLLLNIFLFSPFATSVNIDNVTVKKFIVKHSVEKENALGPSSSQSTSYIELFQCKFTQLPNETVHEVNWYIDSLLFNSYSLINQSTFTSINSTFSVSFFISDSGKTIFHFPFSIKKMNLIFSLFNCFIMYLVHFPFLHLFTSDVLILNYISSSSRFVKGITFIAHKK